MNQGAEVEFCWPDWQTVRLIGKGSFGSVYEIQRTSFGKTEQSALKVITIPQSQSDLQAYLNDGMDEDSATAYFHSCVEEIVEEFALMAKLKGNSNIVSYEDHMVVEHSDGIGWDILIRMELLTPLPVYIREHPMDEQAIVQLGIDICKALTLCQINHIIHRDIKPDNIFLSPYGDYKLGDFGIAKTMERTSGGTKIGTPRYMAPEVYNNKPYNASADLYSLGLVLYWALNGRRIPFSPPFPEMPTVRQQNEALARRFRGEAIPAPRDGSEALQKIVLHACAFNPQQRFSSAEEMRIRLLELLQVQLGVKPVQNIESTEVPIAVETETSTMGAIPILEQQMPCAVTETPATLAAVQLQEQMLSEPVQPEKKPWLTGKRKKLLVAAAVLLVIGGLTAWRWNAYTSEQAHKAAEQAAAEAAARVEAERVVERNLSIFLAAETLEMKRDESEHLDFQIEQETVRGNGDRSTESLQADDLTAAEQLSFSVENSTIAEIDETGLITARKAGETTITVVCTADGQEQDQKTIALKVLPLVEEWRVEGYEAAAPHKEYACLYWDGEKTDQWKYTGKTKPAVASSSSKSVKPSGGGSTSSSKSSSGGSTYTPPSYDDNTPSTTPSKSEDQIYIPPNDPSNKPSDITTNY